jgi:deoxyribodipyrimidine photo-lyase
VEFFCANFFRRRGANLGCVNAADQQGGKMRADEMLHVVWFKRDLRVADHAPLAGAAEVARGGLGKVLGVYFVEPAVTGAEDYAGRHWAATREALVELRVGLARRGVTLAVRSGEATALLERLRSKFGRMHLWSHEETGNAVTYARDRAVRRWARERGVPWTELTQSGVVRRLRSRDGWAANWEERMRGPLAETADFMPGLTGVAEGAIPSGAELGLAADSCPGRQGGTRSEAEGMLRTFFAHRGKNYRREMSSPLTAAEACSRLSVALAVGTVSSREVARAAWAQAAELDDARQAGRAGGQSRGTMRSFLARLHWRCHFMQKLEDEPRIEHEAFLPELDELRAGPWTEARAAHLAAWREGRTGYPLVDACMRALQTTGWINFRMRAMLVSFASYDLWLPWRPSGLHLARLFTDYEPGIHWPQVQMQSGTTGINTLRMYAPVKQSVDQDPHGIFIRRWVSELSGVDDAFVHEPWKMPTAAQWAAGCVVGRDYPSPVVDHAEAVRWARGRFTELKREAGHREAARRVFVRHGSRKRPGTEIEDARWFESPEAPTGIRTAGAQLELGM